MKIGILTQPLHTNYGGILQNYALQTVLKRMGHNPITINHGCNDSYIRWYIWCMKIIIKKLLGRKNESYPLSPKETRAKQMHTAKFITKNIATTKRAYNIVSIIKRLSKIDTYIVGSDQVWRPGYNREIYKMYLDFIPNQSSIRRIAYAASFGVDKWEYTKEQTDICKELVNKFNIVTVRERSGVDLCSKYFDKEAYHVLDPTLLLNKDDYTSLLNSKETIGNKQLTVYVLDMTEDKQNTINYLACKYSLNVLYIGNTHCGNQKLTVPPIEDWLCGISNASMVLTDSFHGTAFSIIFNKPFYVFRNNYRGTTRFDSLLQTFQLEDRIISDINEINEDAIDWDSVNAIRYHKTEESLSLLNNCLSNA